MKNIYSTFWFYINLLACHWLFFFYQDNANSVEKYGNEGAAWWVPSRFLKKDAVVYSGGVGLDISFELALIKKCGVKVYAFDPTPQSKVFIKKFASIERLAFHPWGLWNKNTTLKFYSPTNKDDISHSVVNLQNTTTFFEAKCRTIQSIMKQLGHSKIDLLKIDVEGAEYAVLESILMDKIYPQIICVEFDQPTTALKIWSMIEKLRQNRYLPVKQDYFNFTFVRK